MPLQHRAVPVVHPDRRCGRGDPERGHRRQAGPGPGMTTLANRRTPRHAAEDDAVSVRPRRLRDRPSVADRAFRESLRLAGSVVLAVMLLVGFFLGFRAYLALRK